MDKVVNGNLSKVTLSSKSIDFTLEKLNISKDDTLIIRIPTDKDTGEILVDEDEAKHYFTVIKNNTDCERVIAIPDNYAFEVMDDSSFVSYVGNLNKELDTRGEK